jgi:putative ABC transport system permease protein
VAAKSERCSTATDSGGMRWITIIRLYPGRLRDRIGQEAFAFLGIMSGVALLFAVQVSNSSLGSSIAQMTSGLVGRAQVQVIGREANGLPEDLVRRVEHLPGVEAAAPVVEASGAVEGARTRRAVTLLAADQRVARLGGTVLPAVALAAFPTLSAVILPERIAEAVGAHVDSRVTLRMAGRRLVVPVAAVVGEGAIGQLAQAPVVLAPLRFGQLLADTPSRIARIYVVARAGWTSRVKQTLARVVGDRGDVRPADFDTAVFAQADEPNTQSTALFSQVTAVVGFLFALNGMLMMARGRRMTWAQLRIDGVSVRSLMRLICLDAIVLGVVASLAGLFLGDQLSRHVFPPAPGDLSIGFPIGTARDVQPETILLAFGAGICATVVGSFAPLIGRGGSWETQSATDRQRATSSRLLLAGAVAWTCTAGVLLLAPAAGRLGMVLLVVSMMLCLPAVVGATIWLAQRGAESARSLTATIAVGALRAARGRAVVLAGIAAVAVCASGAIEGARGDLQAGLDSAVRGVSDTTQLWVSPSSPVNQLAVIPFRPEVAEQIATLPHVSRVDVFRGALLTIGLRRVWILGPPRSSPTPVPGNQIVSGDARTANRLVRSGGWAAVSQAVADELHVAIGDSFTLPTSRPRVVRVAAIITNLGWPPGAIVVSADTFRTSWGSDAAGALQVRFDAGTSALEGKAIVSNALAAGPWSGLTAETVAERERQQRRSSRDGLMRLGQIGRLVLVASALAMAIAVASMILQRRPALAKLRLDGISTRTVFISLLIEIGLLVLIGCAAGAVAGIVGVQILDGWLTTLTGFPVIRSAGGAAVATSFATVAFIAFTVAAVPGYVAARADSEAAFGS